MTQASIRTWFCLAVAVLGAAVADPLLEGASNAGWFGPGTFTDHSSLDVLPALLTGCVLAALCLAMRVRWALAGRALASHVGALMPAIFSLQIVTLYCMETAEQYAVWGHSLGGTVWLGAPVGVSLAVHALTCVAVTLIVARSIRSLAGAAVTVIRMIRALTTIPSTASGPPVKRNRFDAGSRQTSPALHSIGERAPPLPA